MSEEKKQAEQAQTQVISKIREMIEANSKDKEVELSSNIIALQDSLKDSVSDAYSNVLNGTGYQDKNAAFTKYIMTNNTLNYMLWMTMYADSWVFKIAIDKPAKDEIRCGITVDNASLKDEQKKEIYDFYKEISNDLIDIAKWGALFGGSIGVVVFNNFEDKDYAEPISKNISKIKAAKKIRLYTTDRWFGVSPSSTNVSNMVSLDFGKPTSYNITFANGKSFKVHHDYILRYEHRKAPKLIQTGLLQNWGYAEGAHIIQELVRSDQLNTDITSLVNKCLIEVIKMDGMKGLFMSNDKESAEQLNKRLEMVNWGRNFNSLTFLDTNDDYNMNSFSGLTGLADLLEKNMWIVSAALEMPGALFGDLRGGLSTDSDAFEKYSETIQSRCEDFIRPVIQKLLTIFYKYKGYTIKPKFSFNSLIRKKEDKEKMEAISEYTKVLSQMLQDGVIDTAKYATLLQQYTQTGVASISFTEEEIKDLETSFDEEMEDINVDEPDNQEKRVLKELNLGEK